MVALRLLSLRYLHVVCLLLHLVVLSLLLAESIYSCCFVAPVGSCALLLHFCM